MLLSEAGAGGICRLGEFCVWRLESFIVLAMYRVISRKEREKLHTESQLTYSRYPQPPDPELSGVGFVHLTRLSDTTLQPEATLTALLGEGSEAVILPLTGTLQYSDTLGNALALEGDDVVVAGAGLAMGLELTNPSATRKVRLLSLSLSCSPAARRQSAGCSRVQRKQCPISLRRGTLFPVASGQGHPDSLILSCDAAIYLSSLAPFEKLIFETLSTRRTFFYLVSGSIRSEDHRILAGDSCEINNESRIPLTGQERSELLLIDLG